jgi:threonine dehydrogenase-like Zn-dependent dehydrogenase
LSIQFCGSDRLIHTHRFSTGERHGTGSTIPQNRRPRGPEDRAPRCPAAWGATPIALTRTSSKRQALLDAGAAHVVATDEQDLVKEILGLTSGKGARVVFDPVGGPTMEKLVGATMPHGIIFIYGALSPEPMTVPALELLAKSIDLRGYWLAEITFPTSDPQLGWRVVNVSSTRAWLMAA